MPVRRRYALSLYDAPARTLPGTVAVALHDAPTALGDFEVALGHVTALWPRRRPGQFQPGRRWFAVPVEAVYLKILRSRQWRVEGVAEVAVIIPAGRQGRC